MTSSPGGASFDHMADELLPPAVEPEAKAEIVPYVRSERDVGSSWSRGLKPDALANLVDLAAELAQVVSPNRDRTMTKRGFYKKLDDSGLYQNAQDKLVQIIGYNSRSIIELYYLWWAYNWTYHYTKCSLSTVHDEESAHDATCARLAIKPVLAHQILRRRDVSAMVGVFFERAAREHKGEMMWVTTVEALKGNPKHAQLYYDKIVDEKKGVETGAQVSFDNMAEHELQAYIAKTRRDVGEPVEAEIEIIQEGG